MNSEVLKNRVKQLEEAVQQSVTNHHLLSGQLQEAKVILEEFLKEEEADAKEAANSASADTLEEV